MNIVTTSIFITALMWVPTCGVNTNILVFNLSPVTTSDTVQWHMDYQGQTAESLRVSCTGRKQEDKQYVPLPYSKYKQ